MGHPVAGQCEIVFAAFAYSRVALRGSAVLRLGYC